jgi:hypothetical protein
MTVHVADFHSVIPCCIILGGGRNSEATGIPRKTNTTGIECGTTLTSFKNIVNMKTPIAVVWKAQQLPQISMHQMAE